MGDRRDRGFDIAIAKARELHDVTICPGTLATAAPTGPFDVISLWHVLEHLPDPPGTLRACRDLLDDGGTIILAMPNDGDAAWSLTASAKFLARRVAGRPVAKTLTSRFDRGWNCTSSISMPARSEPCWARRASTIQRLVVDDAAPEIEGAWGSVAFKVRRTLTRQTPWNLGREMLVVAARRPSAR